MLIQSKQVHEETKILIVGAGPSGLTAANILARYGVDFRIIDHAPGPTEQSRAAIIHIRTLELLDKLGLAETAVNQGLKITDVKIREQGKFLASIPLSGEEHELVTPFPYALAYPQCNTQRLLLDGLSVFNVEVEWQTELLSLSQTEHAVYAIVKQADGQETLIKADWLIGAEGASSIVRKMLNLSFEGSTYEVTAFLADVQMSSTLNPHQLDLNLAQGGFVGVLPFLYENEMRFRLFGAISPRFSKKFGLNNDHNINIDDIQQWFDEYFNLDTRLTKVYWASIYRTHRRISNHFCVNRCFIVGDAAHVHSPAGGQGMNLSIGDAFNLAWKLALVVKGDAHLALLDSYEAERIQVARKVLQGSDRGFEMEATQDQFLEWLRVSVLPLLMKASLQIESVRKTIFEMFSQFWIDYSDSSVVEDRIHQNNGPKAGDRAPYGSKIKTFTNTLRVLIIIYCCLQALKTTMVFKTFRA
jgi:2-polyprenyl-6-methoxyphenol hydroxylase-like FAD-dependent oxidoreductase